MSEIVYMNDIVAQALGIHSELLEEAKPSIEKLSERFGEAIAEIANDKVTNQEAYALAMAITSAIIFDVATQFLDEDEETFYFRLIEATQRKLFDPLTKSKILQQIHQGDYDETEN